MRLSVVDAQRCVGCQSCMFACARRYGEGGFARASIGIRSAGGMSKGFKVVVCRACADPPCARVCPVDALTPRKGGKGGVVLRASKCIGCGHCRQACVVGAVFWDEGTGKPVICKYCGYCADYCPHGVLRAEASAHSAVSSPAVGLSSASSPAADGRNETVPVVRDAGVAPALVDVMLSADDESSGDEGGGN